MNSASICPLLYSLGEVAHADLHDLEKACLFFVAKATEGNADLNLDFGVCYHSRVRY